MCLAYSQQLSPSLKPRLLFGRQEESCSCDNSWNVANSGSRIHIKSMHGYYGYPMNPRIFRWICIKDNLKVISIKTWTSIHGYLLFTDIHCKMSLHEYPCLDIIMDTPTCMDNWRLTPKIIDIYVDIRGYLVIYVWICYGFSNQGISKTQE